MTTMSTSIRLLLLLLLALATSQQQVSAKRYRGCPEARDLEMDQCAARMGFLGDHSFRVPKNLSAIGTFCTTLKESIGCIQKYSRDCLQGFTKQILTSLLKRGKQQHSLICADNEAKREFMKKMSCLADDKIGQFHTCMDASTARFEHILDQVSADTRLSSLCCSFQIFERDMEATLARLCGKPATRRGSINEFIQKVVGGTAGEFLSLICDNLRSLDDCKRSAQLAPILAQLEEVTAKVKKGRLVPHNKSLVPVLLEILDSSARAPI